MLLTQTNRSWTRSLRTLPRLMQWFPDKIPRPAVHRLEGDAREPVETVAPDPVVGVAVVGLHRIVRHVDDVIPKRSQSACG